MKMGGKPYNAKQIIYWLFNKRVSDFSGMTNIPLNLRNLLSEKFYIGTLEILQKKFSKYDGTIKYLLQCKDENRIECVFLPHNKRNTICISSQIGCRFKCVFCATGSMGFKRNLLSWEITEQLFLAEKDLKCRINNIVFMGMGEPLDNYYEVKKAIEIFIQNSGFSRKNIVVSTSGYIPGLIKFIKDEIPVRLSLSLNSAVSPLRSELMPANKKYPLEKIMPLLQKYTKFSRQPVTFEYILIKGVNDSVKDAENIAKLSSHINCKINLVPLNPVMKQLGRPDVSGINLFYNYLKNKKVNVTIRQEKGADISAACGQLACSQG